MNRRVLLGASVAHLAVMVFGCGGSSGTDGATIDVLPKSVSLSPGQAQTFQGGTLEYNIADTRWRVVESDGGTIVDGPDASGNYPRTATYTAPDQAGKYHVQFVFNNGTAPEVAATATVIVTKQ